MHRVLLESEERAAVIAFRGLTLEERLRLGAASPASGKIENYDATERLKVWRSWFDRDEASTNGWKDFLAENNLTEKRLIALERRSYSKQKLPSWAMTLDRVCRYLETANLEPNDELSVSENLAATVVGFAWAELSGCANLQLLSGRAAVALKQSLFRRLAWTAEQAVTWEMSVAKSACRVSKDLEPERDLQRYFFSSGVTKEALRLLKNYPALARLWAVQIEFWQRYVRDFLEDTSSFARDAGIRAKGAPIISSVDVDLSDPHEGNRSVLRVKLRKPWFYKPRPGWQERAWFELLSWINAHGFPRPFRILKVTCEDRHCWMESVQARPCRNEKEALLFCFRTGALMCLIHLLRGVDFHPENVIVAGPHPVVIDCETLLHSATSLPEYARAEDASIRRTGMLMLVKRIPVGIFGWQGNNDRMLKELVGGFRAVHEFARRDGSALRHLQRWARDLRKVPARNIYRPTAHYRGMLTQSLAPALLTSGLERSLFLHACCRDGVNPSGRVKAEVAALQNADVPVFRRKPSGIKFDLSEKTLEQSIAAITAAFKLGADSSPRV